VETVKTVSEELKCFSTGLKPGVNETTFEAKRVMEILDYSKLLQDGLELRTAWGNANLKCHKLGELVTPTGKIVACDPFVFPETSAFTVQLSPGCYPDRL
jgi:hypothetical protein